MRPAQFEEKDFEGPLYNQLLFGGLRLATPGQVFEGHYGIDAALEALHPLFWDVFGYPDVLKGCCLNDFNWGFVWRRLGQKRPLPNFSTNLLVQSKRPDVLARACGPLHTYGLSAPVWRYTITPHQQLILQRVARTIGSRAMVIYASTAFDTFDELYAYTDAGTIVEHCNFTRVQRLMKHKKWNYDSPGTIGVATSEPELIEDEPFSALMKAVRDAHEPRAEAEKELLLIADGLAVACREGAGESPLARRATVVLERLTSHAAEFHVRSGAALSFLKCLAVFRVLGVQWLVGGDESEQEDATDGLSLP